MSTLNPPPSSFPLFSQAPLSGAQRQQREQQQQQQQQQTPKPLPQQLTQQRANITQKRFDSPYLSSSRSLLHVRAPAAQAYFSPGELFQKTATLLLRLNCSDKAKKYFLSPLSTLLQTSAESDRVPPAEAQKRLVATFSREASRASTWSLTGIQQKMQHDGYHSDYHFLVADVRKFLRAVYYFFKPESEVSRAAQELEAAFLQSFEAERLRIHQQTIFGNERLSSVCGACGARAQVTTFPEQLVHCAGTCLRSFHRKCLPALGFHMHEQKGKFSCHDCKVGRATLQWDSTLHQYFYFFFNPNRNKEIDFLTTPPPLQPLSDVQPPKKRVRIDQALNEQSKKKSRQMEESNLKAEMFFDPLWNCWRAKTKKYKESFTKVQLEMYKHQEREKRNEKII